MVGDAIPRRLEMTKEREGLLEGEWVGRWLFVLGEGYFARKDKGEREALVVREGGCGG